MPLGPSPADENDHRLRAVLYLRMSTDMQTYSLAHQREALERYAALHSLTIVGAYEDPARSGLHIATRPGLRRLLQDVVNAPSFQVVLVYDVSRWGRFQDADEAAYYEFLCRLNGVGVRYCAESFDDDTGLAGSVMKAMKRVMAAEYSRELSGKVCKGHERLFHLGFHQGGPAPFATRRWLVDAQGRDLRVLEDGERKSLHSDRVVLRAGPEEERAVVRRIFTLYALEERPAETIAREFRAAGCANARGRPLRRQNVIDILRNEVYVGVPTYGKVTQRLGGRRRRQPPQVWLRHTGGLEPMVDPALFARSQARLLRSPRPRSDAQILQGLRMLLEREGELSSRLIDRDPNTPSAEQIGRRFGGLCALYARLGYTPSSSRRRRIGRTELSIASSKDA